MGVLLVRFTQSFLSSCDCGPVQRGGSDTVSRDQPTPHASAGECKGDKPITQIRVKWEPDGLLEKTASHVFMLERRVQTSETRVRRNQLGRKKQTYPSR